MNGYAYLITRISIGAQDSVGPYISEEYAAELLELAIAKFNLKRGPNWGKGNNCAEGDKYFAYVGEFPQPHLALDNKSGTKRLHTITSIEQLNKL